MNVVYTVHNIHPCFQLDNFTILLFPPDPSAVCALVYLVLGLLSAVTVCGNLLVIISIVYFKQLHIPTNYLILSLAVADLLVGVVVFPVSMTQTVTSCLYDENIFYRYYAICKPLTYKSIVTVRVTGVMIFMCWSLSAMIAIGIVIGGYSQGTCEKTCTVNVVLSNVSGPVFAFFMPALIMICIYLKIFFVAQRQRNSIQISKCGAISKTERKATKTLAIVMGVFLLCMTPYFLCIVFLPLASETPPFSLIEALNWLTLSNSMLNPFIYAFFYSWFQAACKVILSGQIFTGNFTSTRLM
ncbi:trace amine-associated receptor 1-like [Boleophthalmus pectinirostris]|uniref:trace amine-associated receptor 1-like n=1 Tax=Boleophthalmus pectinirostris TaxID=150288 RepID=UPI00242D7C59|nr:trace amine-associated receptor 1-like [Boleophthalmus pectinirostris]